MHGVIIRDCNPDEFGDEDWNDVPQPEENAHMSDFARAAHHLARAAAELLDDGGRSLAHFEALAAALAAFKTVANTL